MDTPIDPAVAESIACEMVQNHGLKYFPDWLERKLYKNVILAVLKLADVVFKRVSLRVFGHDIVIDVRRGS